MVGEVVDVGGAVAGLVTIDGNAGARVTARQIGREIKAQEMRAPRAFIRGVWGLGGPNREKLERARPRQRKLALEHLLVGVPWRMVAVVLQTQANLPTEKVGGMKALGNVRIPALDTGHIWGMAFVDEFIRKALAINSKFAMYSP